MTDCVESLFCIEQHHSGQIYLWERGRRGGSAYCVTCLEVLGSRALRWCSLRPLTSWCGVVNPPKFRPYNWKTDRKICLSAGNTELQYFTIALMHRKQFAWCSKIVKLLNTMVNYSNRNCRKILPSGGNTAEVFASTCVRGGGGSCSGMSCYARHFINSIYWRELNFVETLRYYQAINTTSLKF